LEPLFLFFVGWIGGAFVGLALTIARVSWTSVWTALAPHRQSPIAIRRGTDMASLRKDRLQEIRLAMTLTVAPVPLPPIMVSSGPDTLRESPLATLASLSCPACGLVAPEKLMREHFMGSPLHENSAPCGSKAMVVSAGAQIAALSAEDEGDRTALGDLLQTLNVMERLLKRDFYRHELRFGSRVSARMANIG
jgi:hypothetical protein